MGDCAATLRETCGLDDNATRNILLKYKQILAVTKNKGGRRKDDHAMWRAERDWAANALSFVGASRPKLADLGFEVGKDLHNSVTGFVARGKAIYGAAGKGTDAAKRSWANGSTHPTLLVGKNGSGPIYARSTAVRRG